MTATRSRKEDITYKNYLKTIKHIDCIFCQIDKHSHQFVKETKYFKIIKNIFPYSLWDGQEVADHLMLVPKAHTNSLASMPDAQKVEYVNTLEAYEAQGYNIYARAPVSVIKSVVHQHTHFIKPKGKSKKFVLLLRKPYIRLFR